MINLKYIASSGNEYELNARILTRVANFHAWKWSPVGVDLKYGQRVSDFSRDAITYAATLVFRGTRIEKRALIDALHTDFETDIRNLKPGRIEWRDYYIPCYINESKTEPADSWTENEIAIYCPRPFWVKEDFGQFLPGEAQGTFLDYAYDYQYDYYGGPVGTVTWLREHPFASDFRMVIYGAATTPAVYVNGHKYGITTNIASGAYVTIDSRNHTVIQTNADGTTTNLFDYRDKTESIFELIPGGDLSLVWTGSFGFDMTIFDERSEPAWS